MKCIMYGVLTNCGYEKMLEQSRRVYDPKGISPTLHTMGGGGQEIKIVEINEMENANSLTTDPKDSIVSENIRIRRLTPKECTRLMGFRDKDYEAMHSVNSDTQVYKQCGNSIVVDVLYHIFKQMC